MTKFRSVPVRGGVLRRHRKEQFSSAEAFAAACGSVSVPTVYRAERGGPILRSYLDRMAAELALAPDVLIARDPNSELPTLSGTWWGAHVVADRFGNRRIMEETLELQQSGQEVEGETSLYFYDQSQIQVLEDGRLDGDVFSGHLTTKNSSRGHRQHMFSLAFAGGSDWLQGFFSWFDQDTHRLESSRYLMIRKGTPDTERRIAEAKANLQGEMYIWQLRRLLDDGYDLDQALGILQRSAGGVGAHLGEAP